MLVYIIIILLLKYSQTINNQIRHAKQWNSTLLLILTIQLTLTLQNLAENGYAYQIEFFSLNELLLKKCNLPILFPLYNNKKWKILLGYKSKNIKSCWEGIFLNVNLIWYLPRKAYLLIIILFFTKDERIKNKSPQDILIFVSLFYFNSTIFIGMTMTTTKTK